MTTQTETQTEVVAKEKTPFEIAHGKVKAAVTKLSKVEGRAAEFDAKVQSTNKEIMDFASGAAKQTNKRNMLVVIKEQNAAQNKAEKIRKSGGALAAEAREAMQHMQEIVAGLTAPYANVPVSADDEDVVGDVDGDTDAADDLDDIDE